MLALSLWIGSFRTTRAARNRYSEDDLVARVIPVSKFDLVLFGATGDLARRKIWPGLFHRFLAGQFDTDSRILGVSRSELSEEQFHAR